MRPTAGRSRQPRFKPLLQSIVLGCTVFLLVLWVYHTSNFAARHAHPTVTIDAQHRTHQAGSQPLRHTVWWFAPFLSGGGYSTEATSFALGLFRGGYVTRHGDAVSEEVLQGLPEADRRDLSQMMAAADYRRAHDAIIICHSEPGAWALPQPLFETSFCPPNPKKRLYAIGRTMFETDRLSRHHVERCNAMDEIWVPTDFHKKVFANSGVHVRKLHVIGEAVDVDHFHPERATASSLKNANRVFGPARDKNVAYFRFLSVFKWEARKGWDVLLAAYLTEFSASDPVALYLKTMPYHSETDYASQMRAWVRNHLKIPASRMDALPRVYVLGQHVPQRRLPSLYKAADAFVLPSRGEGWGRPHVEAMSMGLPVLTTFWSGPTAYLTEENGYPLRIDGLVPLPEDSPFKGHQWAQPSVTHLSALMRHVVDNPREAKEKGRRARATMVANFTSQALAAQVADRLRAISATLRH